MTEKTPRRCYHRRKIWYQWEPF